VEIICKIEEVFNFYLFANIITCPFKMEVSSWPGKRNAIVAMGQGCVLAVWEQVWFGIQTYLMRTKKGLSAQPVKVTATATFAKGQVRLRSNK
jgi:hypothetical protein